MNLSRFSRIIRKWFTDPKVPYGVFWFMLLLVAVVVTRASTAALPQQPIIHADHYAIGDALAMDGVTFSVQRFRTDAVGEGPLKPVPGNMFLMPTISITNNTGKNFELVPILYFYIKDSTGNVYDITAAPIRTSQLTGPILPGETVTEEIGFEVPAAIDHPALYFERGTSEHPVAAVDLVNPQ